MGTDVEGYWEYCKHRRPNQLTVICGKDGRQCKEGYCNECEW